MTSLNEAGQQLQHLLGRLEERVRAAVARRQATDPDPTDRFRGLYISDDQATSLFDDRGPLVDPTLRTDMPDGPIQWDDSVPLGRLALAFELDMVDIELLLIIAAPDFDPRFERAYGYLHDDVSRRRASIGLAIELSGGSPLSMLDRERFSSSGRLVRFGLVIVEELDRPVLTRQVRVPDELLDYFVSGRLRDPVVTELVSDPLPIDDAAATMTRAISSGCMLVYVTDRSGSAAVSYTVKGVRDAGLQPLVVDLDRVSPTADLGALARALTRAARLDRAVLVAGPIDRLRERDPFAPRVLAELECPTVLMGSAMWDPEWSRRVPLRLDAPEIVSEFTPELPYRLTPDQAARARIAADLQAIALDEPVGLLHLADGARAQNASGLERLSLRITPHTTFDDLVLPDVVLQQLHDIVARVRYRSKVLGEWAVHRAAAKGRGVTALFAGDSGTGKTLSAEAVAGVLGLDLYVIDLATVIDKYIGETEKNLDRIFGEADRVNGVLLFDEADAIFGKRSEVHDARDRYANVEVAYLLQRMERFDGIAVLTTNLRANLDDAFLRRLDALVDFPSPDEQSRALLWERHLPPTVPRADDVDVAFLARGFELSGGNIRNVAVAAAFLAAAEDRPVSMADLIKSTGREYRKLGRLCLEAEFGEHLERV